MKKLIIGMFVLLFSLNLTFAETETLNKYLTTRSRMGADSCGLATGIFFVFRAVQNYKAKNMTSALTSAATGLTTALGSLAFITVSEAANDPLKEFKESEEYGQILDTLGEDRGEEFVLDVLAGWDLRNLARKYANDGNYADIVEGDLGSLTMENLPRFLEGMTEK